MAKLSAGYDETSIRLPPESRYVTDLTVPGACPDPRKPSDESRGQFAAYAKGSIR